MPLGIEHRLPDTVVEAYEYWGFPNWAIYAGKDKRTQYVDGDTADGELRLIDALAMLKNAQTGQTYILRVYPASQKVLKWNTESESGTTFNFDQTRNYTKDPQTGMIVIDRGTPGARSDNAQSNNVRLTALEEENKRLRDDLHKQELEALKTHFDSKIAGLSQEPEKGWIDRIESFLEKLIEKPEIVDKIGSLFDRKPKKDYITTDIPMNGTESTTAPEEADMADTYTVPSYTDEQLKHLTEDEHDQVQSDALCSIAERIGEPTLTKMILAVARLDDKQLNKLLNHLDD